MDNLFKKNQNLLLILWKSNWLNKVNNEVTSSNLTSFESHPLCTVHYHTDLENSKQSSFTWLLVQQHKLKKLPLTPVVLFCHSNLVLSCKQVTYAQLVILTFLLISTNNNISKVKQHLDGLAYLEVFLRNYNRPTSCMACAGCSAVSVRVSFPP